MRFFAPLFFAALSGCSFFTIFSEVAAHTSRKSNCISISHSVGYSVVKEHFGADSLGLLSRSYSLAELSALYIGLLKNHRKINPHSKTFSW